MGVSGLFATQVDAQVMAGTSIYVRQDTDKTTVIAPRWHVGAPVADRTRVDFVYTADVWTSASIDIRASASRPVTEQRDELDFALSHTLEDLTLTTSYRYSVENDYESHGATGGGSLNLADNNTTLALNLYGFLDSVGRSGDPKFDRGLGTLGTRFSFTQVLDTKMLAQVTYELAHLDGYQASPYRFVGIGGTGFGCLGAVQCLAEHEPDSRTRHAFAVLLRRALSDQISLGANYRFYLDDWGLSSHTIAAQLGWTMSGDTSLALRYRFYTQGGVRFYKPVYLTLPTKDEFTTRDREQSPMHDHRIGLDIQQKAGIGGDQGATLVLNAGVGGDFYSYDNFVGLKSTKALEITFAVTLER